MLRYAISRNSNSIMPSDDVRLQTSEMITRPSDVFTDPLKSFTRNANAMSWNGKLKLRTANLAVRIAKLTGWSANSFSGNANITLRIADISS